MPIKKFKYRRGQKHSSKERAEKFADKIHKITGEQPLVYKVGRKWDKKRGWVNYNTYIVEYSKKAEKILKQKKKKYKGGD